MAVTKTLQNNACTKSRYLPTKVGALQTYPWIGTTGKPKTFSVTLEEHSDEYELYLSEDTLSNLPPSKATLQEHDIEDIESNEIPEATSRLTRFKKGGKLSVTDFSAQLWCEQQLEFVLITGKRRETEAMRLGTARHELLEKEDHDVIEVMVGSREDSLGLRMLNTVILIESLLKFGSCREMWVFGFLDGVFTRGVIDELSIRKAGNDEEPLLYIADTKTRQVAVEPSDSQKRTSAMQTQVYHRMISDLQVNAVDFGLLAQVYKCDRQKHFGSEYLAGFSCLDDIFAAFKEAFLLLPQLSSYAEVVYECQGVEFARNKVPVSYEGTEYAIRDLVSWWKGERPTESVMRSEKWKCKFCDFHADCKVSPLERIVEKSTDVETEHDDLSTLDELVQDHTTVNATSTAIRASDVPTTEDGGHPVRTITGHVNAGASLTLRICGKRCGLFTTLDQGNSEKRMRRCHNIPVTRPGVTGASRTKERRGIATSHNATQMPVTLYLQKRGRN